MVEYPIEFASRSEVRSGEEKWNLETDEGLETKMSVPEDFGGDTEYPSPEDLFAASVQSCMVATFKKVAERKGLDFETLEAEASVKLDRGEDSRPVMREGRISIDLEGVNDRERAREILEIAEKNCFIHNSIDTEMETELGFS